MIRTAPRSSVRMLAAAAVLVLALAACTQGDGFAARVNGVEITDRQVGDTAVLYRFLGDLNQAPCGQATEGESSEAACNRFTLGTLIQEELIKAYAAEHDLEVSDETIGSALSQVAGVVGGEVQLEEALAEDGLERADLVELARRLLLFDEVQGELARTELTDERLRAAYDRDASRFAELHTQHILVETQEEAAAIAERATAASFAQLARRLSTDPSAQDNAGDLGFLPASSLDPAYVQAALALEPGRIGGPVQSSFGWHVIRLVEVRTQPFAQVRDQLRVELAGQEFRDWVVAAWTDGEIEVNPRYGRFDAVSGLVVGITSNASATPPAEQASPLP